jgi:hypothetical protein
VIASYQREKGIDGKDFETVKAEVEDILKDKLVVVCGGANDFTCLNIPISNLRKTFDIHDFYKKRTGQFTKAGTEVRQPIGLRSLYKHFFGVDIQPGHHSANVDAKATMAMFHKYVDLKNQIDQLDIQTLLDDIPTL